MKKNMIASLMALGLVSGLAQANEKEIKFVGSVTTVTCDINPSVSDSSSIMPGVIQLGSVKTNTGGEPVNFVFKPSDAAGNDCESMADNGTVTLTWTGDNFNNNGLGAISGTASDAYVEITPINDNASAKDFIKASATSHEFSPQHLKTGGEGLKYSAKLQGKALAGDFQTAAKFNFSYK